MAKLSKLGKTMLRKHAAKKRSFKPLLKDLVKFLNVNDKAAKDLWWILTALRGPDSHDMTLKAATTCVIRHKLGIKDGTGNGASVVPDNSASVNYRRSVSPNDGHFFYHAADAFRALDLKWDENNAKKRKK